MKLPAISLARVFLLLLAFSGLLIADAPPLLTTGIEIGSSNERTALSRTTRKLSSTVDVKIKNTSDRLLEAPLHAVISFTPLNGGNLAGLTMPGALGGVGVAPYQTFYKDLSASIGNGLAVGAETTFSFTFERPEGTTVSYAVAIRGIRNNDPNGLIGGPYSGQQGTPVTFDASNSTDPDGEALTFSWDFGDGSTGTGAKPQHAYSATGLFSVVVTVSDPRGAVVTREAQVPISPPGAFALARTRTLDGNGHPLGAVAVTQSGPDGSRTFQSDTVSGFTSLGGQPGDHTWSFAREGYLTSFRETTLDQGVVKVVSFPWLAPLNASRTTLSLLNPTSVKSPAERVTLTVPPEAFEQVVSVALTDLHGQNLPLPLPYGWSPLAAFHLDAPATSAADIAASVKLLQAVPPSRPLVLVHLATATPTWLAESLHTSTGGDTLAVVLRKPGSYAVVIADTLPAGNPALAEAGQPLPAGAAAVVAPEVTAAGVVNPAATVANLDPARVTATATVDFTNGTQPLASGAWFLADVQETYDLRDGQAFKTPDYDATFYAYQTPGDASASTATASFPLRPRILFGPDQLTEANLKVDVLALNQFSGGIVTQDGGLLSLPGLRIGIPAGAVAGPSATEIRLISTANLSRFLGEFQPLLAFEINLPRLADGTSLDLGITQKLAPDSHYVLARCVNSGSESGLQPVLRLRSDSQGVVTPNEPASGPRLPGITGSGQFVVVKITAPQALITGLVRKVGGALLPAAIVRVSAEPWLSFTGGAGTFSTLAKPGERNVIGSDPTDGNSGQATASLANATATANVEIQTAATGPRVVATTPADGATKVKPTTPITVRFSEPLDSSSFGPTALNVTNPHGVKVIGSLSLNNAGTEATFLPINPLEQAAHYTIELAATLRDRSGLPIEGLRTFTFAVIPFFGRPVGAKLVIYEPDAKNVPQSVLDQLVGYVPGSNLSMVVATGSPGTADPEVPVILFNEETAETATVLSKPDGSFATFINASAGDFIKAAFVNSNGTVVTVPATRQLFDDGRVGLYEYGGILEAESDGGPVQVLIEPEAIKERSVFKVDVFSVNQLAELTGGVLPEGENTALPGVKIEVEGAPPEGGAEISFPLNPDSLGLVPGVTPEEAGFALTTPVEIDGQIVYLTVDSMRFENGKLFTNTCPFKGAYNPQLLDDAISIGANVPGVVGASITAFQTLVPILVAKGTGGVVINGSVAQLPVSDIKLIEKARLAQLAAAVFSIVPQALNFGRIAKLVSLEKKIKALQAVAGSALADVAELGIHVVEEVQTNGAPPVQGALIALRSNDAVFDGRIKPGIVCAISDENGCYSLKAPALGGLKLVGTHPRLGRAADVSLGAFDFFDIKTKGFIARNVFFGINDEFLFSNTRPRLAVSQSPLDPQISQPVTVTVDAFARAGLPVSIAYSDSRSEFQTRLLGQGVSSSDVVVTAAPPMEVAPGQTRVVFTVTGAKSMNAVLVFQADASAEDGSVSASIGHAMSIGATRPQITNPLAPSDPEDKQPPQVVSISPPDGSFLYPGQKVFVRFSEPLDKASILEPGGVIFGTLPYPELSLSADQTTLEVLPRNLPQGGSITMTLGFSLADLADNHLAPSVSTSFFLGSLGHAALPGVGSGGGTVLDASTLYVLDRGPSPGVRVFDVSNPFSPFQRIHVPAVSTPSALDFPRDLALIKDWSHVPGMEGNNERPATIRPLLAVVGGLTGSAFVDNIGNETQQGQYLTILDISNPSAPQLVQNVRITVRPSTVPKVRWQPPFLTYLENSADSHFVSIVDLQELLIGFSVPTFQRLAVFGKGRKGTDINGDGDYTDVNEFRPKPNVENVNEFIGYARGYDVLPFPRQRIEDFDDDGLGDLAVVRSLSGLSEPIPTTARPEFRLLMAGGNNLPQEAGFTSFERGARPKRVLLLPRVRSEDGTVRNLAVVSLSPDADGKQKLAVVDWSQTVAPLPVKKILLPDDADIGVLQSPSIGPDGLLRVAATSKVLVFDPAKLLFDGSVGVVHPSLMAILPEGGSGTFSIGENDAGVRAVALGGRNELTVSPPSLGFVQFSGLTEVPRPDTLYTNVVERDRVLAAMRRVSHLRPARFRAMGGAESSLSPPSPLVHSHVLVNAPGGAGRTIPLLLQSLNEAGKPIAPKGVDYPPVHAGASLFETKPFGEVSEDINPTAINFTGYRISDDPSDPSYNLYLSDPIVVLREKVSPADLQAILTARARVVLWSEAAVRATIDISAPPPLNLFSADFDRQAAVYRPKVAAFASTLPGGYVPGSTAPPVGGELPIPGTFGTIDAASGEFRHSTVDLELPSRRLPIVFERTATSHALVSSAFGRGWDFVYNQRAIELKAELVPPGQQEPITERGGPGKDKVGASTDIILSNGAGHAILFKNRGSNAPPGVDNDPLINLLGWNIIGGEFYTPAEEEKGVFDLMYRYPSGEKARLTPEGVLFRYNEAGLLTKIEDRYPKNAQLLDYNINGELIRIRDLSVSDDRMVRLGYFRMSAGVAGFDSQVDKAATKGLHVGRICSLVDFAGRRVDFEYDDNGRLVRRLGISVEGENNGFVGRPQVTYTIDPATKAYTGVIAGAGAHGGGTSGNAGTPLSVATTTPNSRGEAVANETKGAGGAVAVQVPAGRSAATVANGSTAASHADASKTAMTFDANGYPAGITMTGPSAGQATYGTTHNARGLPETITYPEGNSITFEYEPESAPLRARANVRKTTQNPGPRGGPLLVSEATYDHRYNLPAGLQKDFNGNSITMNLRSDGRDLVSAVYPKAGSHTIGHNDFGQVTQETTVEGIVTEMRFDVTTGYLTRRALGGIANTEFGYDSSNAAKLGQPTTITPPRGAPIAMEYDDRLQATRMTRSSQDERKGYDENGNVVTLSRVLGDGAPYEELREYSQINFLNKLTVRGVESAGGSGDLVTRFTPDPLFRVKEINLPGGEKRTLEYDHLGNVTKMELGTYKELYGRDLHGNMVTLKKGDDIVQEIEHDGHDRPVEMKSKTGTGGDEVTAITYFGKGEMKTRTVTGSVGGVVSEVVVTDVDELGRPLVTEAKGNQANARVTSDYKGNGGLTVTANGPVDTSASTHDAAGRPRTQVDSLRNVTLTPDANGNVEKAESVEDGETYSVDMIYNGLDQLTKTFDPVGTLVEATQLRADGLPLSTKDGRENPISKTYSRLGEMLTLDKPEQLRFAYAFNANRQQVAVRDRANAGNVSAYTDGTLRPTATTWRNGSTSEFNAPDGRNLPTSITIPGGSMVAGYDLQGRVLSLDTTYSGGNYKLADAKYDALGRLRSAKYGSSGQFSMTVGYDKLGPNTSTTYNEVGGTYPVSSTIRADGARLTLVYPSGVTVTETRQASGRLTKVTVGGDSIWEAMTFAGAGQPATIKRGASISESCLYDARRRLTARRFTGPGDAVLEDLRFKYDGTDNVVVRQSLVGGGRADVFAFDAANRLVRADYGVRPTFSGTNRDALSLPSVEGFAPGLYARTHGYDAGGLDLLQGSTLINPDALPLQTSAASPLAIPQFSATIGEHDSFLFPQNVNGFSRGAPDPLGNTARTQLLVRPTSGLPQVVPATLAYNAHSNLIRVQRDDGVTIDCQYRPDKLLHHRKVTGGTTAGERALVWHEGRLLEEYNVSSGRTLVARYYYANDDPPVAADLRQSDGTFLRVHFLWDHVLSVVAIANEAGEILERVRYDAWGQPAITTRDTSPPRIAEVRRDGNDILVVMSEPVLPPMNAVAGSSIESSNGKTPAQAFRIIAGGGEQSPTVVFEENVPGLPFATVFRLTPNGALSGAATLRVLAGGLVDGWNNSTPGEDFSFTFTAGPVLASGVAPGSTAPASISRSAIGNPWLWQGQWFDYDAGLTYMRARHYDPGTGQFLQRDPMQYEDSGNLYAGMANNTVRFRDPSGLGQFIRIGGGNGNSGAGVFRLQVSKPGKALSRHVDNTANNQKSFKPARSHGESDVNYNERIGSYTENAEEIERYGNWFAQRGLNLEFTGAGVSKLVFTDPKKNRAYSILKDSLQDEGVMMNLRGAAIWDALGMNNYYGIHKAGEFRLRGDPFDRPLIVSDTAVGFRDAGWISGNGSVRRGLTDVETTLHLPQAEELAQRVFWLVEGKSPKSKKEKMGPDWTQWGVDGSGNVRMLDAPNTSAAGLKSFWERYLGGSTGKIDFLNDPN